MYGGCEAYCEGVYLAWSPVCCPACGGGVVIGVGESFAKFRGQFARGAAGAELTAPLASQAVTQTDVGFLHILYVRITSSMDERHYGKVNSAESVL